MGYIYKITNNENGKIYIGQTKQDIQSRFIDHKKCAEQFSLEKLGHRSHLYSAMNLYGADSFSVSLVEQCEDENLDEEEKYWIKRLNSQDPEVGYNISPGGTGGCVWGDPENHPSLGKQGCVGEKNGFYGKHHSEEDKQRQREFMTGSKLLIKDGKKERVPKNLLEEYYRKGYVSVIDNKKQLKKDERERLKEERKQAQEKKKKEQAILKELNRKPRTSWNKGLTKDTDVRMAKMAEKKLGKPSGMLGKHHSEEFKQKLNTWRKESNYHPSEETKQKIREVYLLTPDQEKERRAKARSELYKDRHWVTNGKDSFMVDETTYQFLKSKGFIDGRKLQKNEHDLNFYIS